MINQIRTWLRGPRKLRELKQWERNGRPAPPPHLVKQQTVRDHAERFGCSVLVETGTYLGDMVAAMLGQFGRIYSIELSDEYFHKAEKRFAGCGNVTLIHGDSGIELGRLLDNLDPQQRTLFWLDGHWSAGDTAKGDKETPIAEELLYVLPRVSRGDVILIDDARLFGVDNDYPPMEVIRECVEDHGLAFAVEDDLIRITAPATAMRIAA